MLRELDFLKTFSMGSNVHEQTIAKGELTWAFYIFFLDNFVPSLFHLELKNIFL